MRAALALALLACACAPRRWLALDEKDLAPGVWPEASAERLLDETTVRFRLEQGRPVMEVTEHVATRLLRKDALGVLLVDGRPGVTEVLEASARRVTAAGRVVRERVADMGATNCSTGERRWTLPLGKADPGEVVEWRVTRLVREPLEMGLRLSLQREEPVVERRLVLDTPDGWEVSFDVPDGHSVTPNLDHRREFTRTLLAWFQIAGEKKEPLSSPRGPEAFLQLRAWRDSEGEHRLPGSTAELSRALEERLSWQSTSAASPKVIEEAELASIVRATRADVERCHVGPDSGTSLSVPALGLMLELSQRLAARGAKVELGLAIPHRGNPLLPAPASLSGMRVALLRVNGVWLDPMGESNQLRRFVLGAPVLVIGSRGDALETLPWTNSEQAVETLSLTMTRRADGLVGRWLVDRAVNWPDGALRPWLPESLAKERNCDMGPCPLETDPGADLLHASGSADLPGVWPEGEPLRLSHLRGALPVLPEDPRRQSELVLGPPRTERFLFRLEGARLKVVPRVVETDELRSTLEPTPDGGLERVDVWKVPVVDPANYERVRSAFATVSAIEDEPLVVELIRD